MTVDDWKWSGDAGESCFAEVGQVWTQALGNERRQRGGAERVIRVNGVNGGDRRKDGIICVVVAGRGAGVASTWQFTPEETKEDLDTLHTKLRRRHSPWVVRFNDSDVNLPVTSHRQ
jgi:hypothetical protein